MKRTRYGIAVLFALFTSLSSAQTGSYIITDAVIRQLMNTSGNTQSFAIEVVGGGGPCASLTGATIVFPLSAAPDADTHKRAYAAALMAMSTGMRVAIYNYSGTACDGASYIRISPP